VGLWDHHTIRWSCAILLLMNYREAERILSGVMDRLEQERTRQGLSLQRLGALSGIDRTMIGKIEKGERSPTLIVCLRVADALGLNLGDVLNDVRKKRRRK
jgi:transcriptional regulator with XRE-family HTH domain